MTNTTILAGIIGILVFSGLTLADAEAAIFVKIDGVKGDVTTKGYDDGNWFVADSFSFGVEREMKESGEKGGTEDINIGVGELQECTISKSMDTASANLAQFAIKGKSPGTAEIHFVEIASDGSAEPYLVYKLNKAVVTSWQTSGSGDDRPTEEVAFNFNKIAFATKPSADSEPSKDNVMSWNKNTERPWRAIIDSILETLFPDEPEPPRTDFPETILQVVNILTNEPVGKADCGLVVSDESGNSLSKIPAVNPTNRNGETTIPEFSVDADIDSLTLTAFCNSELGSGESEPIPASDSTGRIVVLWTDAG